MTRPGRSPDEEFQAHVEAGELRFQCCQKCGTRRWPPQSVCHRCLSAHTRWDAATEAATVLSYLVVHDSIIPSERIPFAIVHVEFDDGVRFTAPLHGAVPSALTGRRVKWRVRTIRGRPVAQLELVERNQI